VKSALKPLLLILGLIVVLAAVAYFYEQKWGLAGPFPSQHHHDHEPAPADVTGTNQVETGEHHQE